MSTQNAHWVSYLTFKEDQPYIVGLDLNLSHFKTTHLHPFVSTITLHGDSENIRPDGFPNAEELDKLQVLDDKIATIADRIKGSIFCGWLTGHGKRTLFFYVANPKPFVRKMEGLLKTTAATKTEVAVKKDAKWDVFFDALYPSGKELNSIKNQGILSLLEEQGDDLTTPRKTEHWAYFEKEEDRTRYEDELSKTGFDIEKKEFKAANKSEANALQFSHITSIDGDTIDKVTWDLRQLAQQFGGRYDGWEALLVKPQT